MGSRDGALWGADGTGSRAPAASSNLVAEEIAVPYDWVRTEDPGRRKPIAHVPFDLNRAPVQIRRIFRRESMTGGARAARGLNRTTHHRQCS